MSTCVLHVVHVGLRHWDCHVSLCGTSAWMRNIHACRHVANPPRLMPMPCHAPPCADESTSPSKDTAGQPTSPIAEAPMLTEKDFEPVPVEQQQAAGPGRAASIRAMEAANEAAQAMQQARISDHQVPVGTADAAQTPQATMPPVVSVGQASRQLTLHAIHWLQCIRAT